MARSGSGFTPSPGVPAASRFLAAIAVTAALLTAGPAAAADLIRSARVLTPDHVRLALSQPVRNLDSSNFRFTEARAPDVPIQVLAVEAQADNHVLLTVAAKLDAAGAYRIEIADPPGARDVRPAPWALLLTVMLSAALINNFVFTRYLGLCIFFGVSKRRDTAIGMGITFTLVMVVSAALSWVIYTLVMTPLKLKFLQIIVFIGIVAFLVQALDTILKKTHRALHQRFGVYLVIITTNCIILAVPLLNAAANATAAESLALAFGAGAGFALALFLMSCARERIELARVPKSFEGLPIAFALTGLFALAFMGFSGLNFMR